MKGRKKENIGKTGKKNFPFQYLCAPEIHSNNICRSIDVQISFCFDVSCSTFRHDTNVIFRKTYCLKRMENGARVSGSRSSFTSVRRQWSKQISSSSLFSLRRKYRGCYIVSLKKPDGNTRTNLFIDRWF